MQSKKNTFPTWRSFKLNTLLLPLCALFCIPSSAQDTMTFDCGKLHLKNIAFKEDTVTSFSNWFTEHNVLCTITKSSADLEIREYPAFPANGDGSMFIIQCFGDSVYLKRVFYLQRNYPDTAMPEKLRVFMSDHLDVDNTLVYSWIDEHSCKIENYDKLKELIETGIFTIDGIEKILSRLREKNIKVIDFDRSRCYDCFPYKASHGNVYEVKFKNKCRNIRLYGGFYQAPENRHIPIFKQVDKLLTVYDNLVINQ